jgi:hypothetical protein
VKSNTDMTKKETILRIDCLSALAVFSMNTPRGSDFGWGITIGRLQGYQDSAAALARALGIASVPFLDRPFVAERLAA